MSAPVKVQVYCVIKSEMATIQNKLDVLIVGAGLSGLLAAQALRTSGAKLRILDKGRGVGGRLATRRLSAGVFDHGAQYFTVKDSVFGTIVEEWVRAGIAKPWADGFRIADGTLKSDGQLRYCGSTGMTAISKNLAHNIDISLNTRVTRVEADDAGWMTTTEGGERILSRALLLTPPVPQSLELLALSQVALREDITTDLKEISYAPCLALLASLDGPSAIPFPGGLWLSGGPLAWMADNRQKGISADDRAAITLHAGPAYSQAHWSAPENEVTATLLEAARPWLRHSVLETHLHRWRYSIPTQTHRSRCLVTATPAPLVFAGDAFGGPRVEGAALSGLAAGAALLQILRQ